VAEQYLRTSFFSLIPRPPPDPSHHVYNAARLPDRHLLVSRLQPSNFAKTISCPCSTSCTRFSSFPA
jgi:hypothetical protein